MKKLLFGLSIAILSSTSFAQSAKFNDAMTKTLAEMDTSSSAEQFMSVANKFERIALAEKNQWLPYYYSGLARCTAIYMGGDNSKTDDILDIAEKHAKIADSLQPKNSEIYVLKTMILGGRIMVDPMTRGQSLGMQSMMTLSEAMKLDPLNPRAYYIMGQSLYYTPPQFGGGVEAGCRMFSTAKENYGKFVPESALHPNWGEDQVDMMLLQCSKSAPVDDK